MAAMGKRNSGLHGAAPDRSAVVMLVLDMVSDFAFKGGAEAARAALPIARRIARLAERARRGRVPVVFVNDNLGRWRSDFPAIRGIVRDPRRRAPPSSGSWRRSRATMSS